MKISVIMTSYNYARYIKEAIESVLQQTYQDWELIIVDDASTDDSVEIIKSYCKADSRIKLVQHSDKSNHGLKETLLLGVKQSSGEYLAFLESDDALDKDNFFKKIQLIKENPEAKIIFNKVRFVNDSNLNIEKFVDIQKMLSKSGQKINLKYSLLKENKILTFSCVMVKKETLLNVSFAALNDTLLDWWLWVQLAYGNEFYYIDEELTNWRIHEQSYIKTGKKPKVLLPALMSYLNLQKQNPTDFKLLIFLIISFIPLALHKIKRMNKK